MMKETSQNHKYLLSSSPGPVTNSKSKNPNFHISLKIRTSFTSFFLFIIVIYYRNNLTSNVADYLCTVQAPL
jgi:hypothetical protein